MRNVSNVSFCPEHFRGILPASGLQPAKMKATNPSDSTVELKDAPLILQQSICDKFSADFSQIKNRKSKIRIPQED
jgi:hypothetical protein